MRRELRRPAESAVLFVELGAETGHGLTEHARGQLGAGEPLARAAADRVDDQRAAEAASSECLIDSQPADQASKKGGITRQAFGLFGPEFGQRDAFRSKGVVTGHFARVIERDKAVAQPSPDILRHQLMKIPVERRDPAEKSGAVMRRVQRQPAATDETCRRRLNAASLKRGRVNGVIDDDPPVRAFFPTPDELSALPLRRAPKVSGAVRVVMVGDFDVTPCGGTHCTSAGQVGLVRLTGVERYKGKVRVTHQLVANGIRNK